MIPFAFQVPEWRKDPRMRPRSLKNFILILVALVALTASSALGLSSAVSGALALEQAARCGMEEHIHTGECYYGDLLACGRKMHTHTENCYLVLLRDNDVNQLLTLIDDTEEHSLESLIHTTVISAVRAGGLSSTASADSSAAAGPVAEPSGSPSLTPSVSPSVSPSVLPSISPSASPSVVPTPDASASPSVIPTLPGADETTLAPIQTITQPPENTDIVALNLAAAGAGESGLVTLNENLVTRAAATGTLSEEELLAQLLSGGSNAGAALTDAAVTADGDTSPAAVGDEPNTADNAVNFYIYVIDEDGAGSWTFISSEEYTLRRQSNNSRTYYRTILPDTVSAALNSELAEALNDYKLFYASSATANNNSWNATGSQTISNIAYTTLGTTNRNSYSTYYVRVCNSGANRVSNNTLQFGVVTYKNENGTTISQEVWQIGSDVTILDPPAGYSWEYDGNEYNGGDTISDLSRSITVTAVPAATYTVTLKYPDGTVTTDTSHGTYTLPEGYVWTDGAGNSYTGGSAVTLEGDIAFTGAIRTYTVTLDYPDGTADQTYTVEHGTDFTLPADLPDGYMWISGSSSCTPGAAVTITGDMTFTASMGNPITVTYDVNFPTNSQLTSANVPVPDTIPTLADGAAGTDTVNGGLSHTARSTSERMITTQKSNGRYAAIYFLGWAVNGDTDLLIQPGSSLTWEELSAYAQSDVVSLVGQWTYSGRYSANFFVKYNSYDDGETSSDYYTPVIFATYVGGISSATNSYDIEVGDSTEYEKDKEVRALYGASSGAWLSTFPTDEYVFEQLKQYASALSVPIMDTEGNYVTDASGNVIFTTVDVNDLNVNGYAIRWYQFKYVSQDDDWHVDGLLVQKQGVINTTKTFAGNATLVAAAKEGFFITAANAAGSKFYIMTIDEPDDAERATILTKLNRDAASVTEWITPIDDEDGNGNTYLWQFDDVEYAEEWTITEYPPDVNDYVDFAEWIIVDSSALNQGAESGDGEVVTVKGVTQATDVDDIEWLRAEFNNIYYRVNSLMLKKEDAATGQALAGAQFQFFQNGALMTFNYDDQTGLYEYDMSGGGAITTITCDGYANVYVDGIAYGVGDITIREVATPEGYNPIGDITIGYTADSDGDGKKDSAIGIISGSQDAQYKDGLLVIPNSSDPVDITVAKEWNCSDSEKADAITVQLLANGSDTLAATILSGRTDMYATVVLTEAMNWSYTWQDMPLYANGEAITWSVRETRIGGENCKADYTFANWIVVTKSAVVDELGNLLLNIENTPKRPMVYLSKTSIDGVTPVPGAVFRLIQVNSDGTVADGAVTKEATTREAGTLYFDNLRYNTWYRLTEVSAPSGYLGFDDAVYIMIAESGAVTVTASLDTDAAGNVIVTAHDYVSASNTAYTIQATNLPAWQLPETGGPGTTGHTLGGALLIAAALLMLYKRSRRREVAPHA